MHLVVYSLVVGHSNAYPFQKGFTLIEMVVVIVLLGILAVTAAPKFMNSQSDARIAVLKGFEGAFHAANDIVMAKAEIAGVLDGTASLKNIPGTELYVHDNFMSVKPEHLHQAMSIDGLTVSDYDSWTYVYFGAERFGEEITAHRCYVKLEHYKDGATLIDKLKVTQVTYEC
ncbi:type II secretion system protein [Photobacterium satsumensis]|uniref:type II secretion system protein n=1 Tax=Photobacterium satsumensis TaxID=2910239 RepID=UPI003D112DCD